MKPSPAGGGPARALETSLSGLVRRYALQPLAEVQLARLLETLVQDPHAPTSIRDPFRGLEDHLADSLVALELDQVRDATLIADLGAGAGLPGLPLAIALPLGDVTMVESNRRKCEFIARTIKACELTNAAVVNERIEEWPDGFERFDLVTARALAPLAVVAEYAAPLLRIGGALLAWRGRRDPADEAAAQVAAAELGLEMPGPRHVEPYPGTAHRHLQLIVKTDPTPARFPRRPGMARKRPLGAREARRV